MRTRPLGKTGLIVSELGFGCAPLGDEYGVLDEADATRLVHAAIDRITLHFGDTLRPYLIDQAAHLLTIAAIALVTPTLWSDSLWTALTETSPLTWF